MSEIEKQKNNVLAQVRTLCAHCVNTPDKPHACPVAPAIEALKSLKGVPLIVNKEFRGILQVYSY